MAQEVTPPSKKPVPWAWIISGVAVLIIGGGIALKALEGSFTYYVQADEYVDRAEYYKDKNVKVAGYVQNGSLDFDGETYRFKVNYMDRVLDVTYTGFAPDTFKEGVEVIVEGRGTGEARLEAKTLMAKCASKYEVGDLPSLQNQEYYQKSDS